MNTLFCMSCLIQMPEWKLTAKCDNKSRCSDWCISVYVTLLSFIHVLIDLLVAHCRQFVTYGHSWLSNSLAYFPYLSSVNQPYPFPPLVVASNASLKDDYSNSVLKDFASLPVISSCGSLWLALFLPCKSVCVIKAWCGPADTRCSRNYHKDVYYYYFLRFIQ